MPNQPSAQVLALLQLLQSEGVRSEAQIEEAIGVDQVDTAAVISEAKDLGLIAPIGGRWRITDDGRKVLGTYARASPDPNSDDVLIALDFTHPMRDNKFPGLSYGAQWERTEDEKRRAVIAADYWPHGFENVDHTHLGAAVVEFNALGHSLISIRMAVTGPDAESAVARRAKAALEKLASQVRP